MKKALFFFVFLAALLLVLSAWVVKNNHPIIYSGALSGQQIATDKEEISIDNNKLTTEIADNDLTRSRGLGGRANLGQDEAMLFVFDQADFYTFWMLDMKFPLDFIWINGDQIVDITQNVPAPAPGQKNLPIYRPKAKADKVLEVNAGWASAHNIIIGDKIRM